MNAYDSAKLLEQLRGEGYRAVDDPREAGLILLNTCAIREKAQMKVYSELGALRELKAERPGLVIGVTGCVAQQEGARLLERNRHVELVVGTDALFALPAALAAVRPGRPVVLTERPRHTPRVENFVPAFAGLPAEPLAPSPVKAQIAITKGCNNFCTFCVVPNTRGREVSREPENILAEARALVARGAREITLLGQNVNSYAAGGTDFVGLLERLDGVAGLARVRYTSPHPKDFHARLAQAHGALATLCEHLHLPVQSGSDRILAAMRRRHTAAEYLEKVALFRAHCPAGAVSTDIIVGFPGESEADFEATLALVRQVRFDHLYAFKFSPRTDTPAARYPDQVAEPVKAERLARLLALHELTQAGLNRALVGTRQEVLVEGPHPRDPSAVVGRTRGNKSTTVVGCRAIHSAQPAALAGTLVTVEIVAARRFSLVGRDVDHESQGLHGNEGVPAGAGPQHELAHRGPAG
ncbi:MAG: tRNA (N6-isopentenyl adenosine(37)-C2)-methylthiotransferase MiaB [Candidatus Lambdaproteobacteria bacterium]|nr:tRNA (N6-isopentenyl adenosine(37)-C2)-methylthiotransferase MiaB [Candidatus Lambdaproteobacteria bacterium]